MRHSISFFRARETWTQKLEFLVNWAFIYGMMSRRAETIEKAFGCRARKRGIFCIVIGVLLLRLCE